MKVGDKVKVNLGYFIPHLLFKESKISLSNLYKDNIGTISHVWEDGAFILHFQRDVPTRNISFTEEALIPLHGQINEEEL